MENQNDGEQLVESLIVNFGAGNLPSKYICACLSCPKATWLIMGNETRAHCNKTNSIVFNEVLGVKGYYNHLTQVDKLNEKRETYIGNLVKKCSFNPEFKPDEKMAIQDETKQIDFLKREELAELAKAKR